MTIPAKFEELDNLLTLCKKHGLTRVKDGDFEAWFGEEKRESVPMTPLEIAKALTEQMPPDSQMLFASAEAIPGVDFPNEPAPPPSEEAQ